nr:protein transport protein Sec16A isoform X2 [Anolis sagrei ordinatus]
MQPPPQTVPPGAGGPPPLAAAQNMYWRNSGPLGRRANAPTTAAASPMRPVTDPFAFGAMQTLRGNPPLGNTAKGDPPAMQSFPPAAFPPPPAVTHPPHLPAGDNSHGLNLPLAASVSQSGAHGTFSSQSTSSLYSERVTNSADMHPNVERSTRNPMDPMSFPLENSLRGQQGSLPPSGQETSRNPNIPTSVPSSTSFLPSAQQTVPQWMAPQGSFQPQGGPPYSVYPEPPSQNAFYAVTQSPLGVSQPHQSTPQQPPAAQNAVQAPLMFGDAPSANAPHNSAWQNAGGASNWSAQIPQEHFYLQPLNTASTPPVHQATQENGRSAQTQGAAEGVTKRDSGTISMFFKGDEAENEEILSLERNNEAGKADVDAFQQTMGHTYYQPLHPVHQVPVPPFSNAVPPPEALHTETDVQNSFRTSNDAPAFENVADKADPVDTRGHVGSHYENVENQECIQNQEVLPSEPLTQSCTSPGVDPNRYASLVGPSLPKNATVSHLEGGPNLEAPDVLLRPGRPDSVSSNYSNLSHRSVSNTLRPQELATFIQQESGKPEEEASRGFFKQIDSSPLGGEASEASPSKNYYGGLSLAPTPSPPKPTGVFQMSANSSFEPVRSHASGIKPLEADQAKMPAERNCPNQAGTKKSPATPVASPGNLEQPPDNLETLFLPQTHPLPLTVTGNVGESAPEKRPSSARAQGSVKKCESPATTLWAHNELPSFGGNVLLAPAAPAVYVPAKQSVQVVQPPEEGVSEQHRSELGSVVLPPLQPGSVSSENLENPPKMGEEEALRSQMSSGYASLLSSPPTEALQNPPVLIAQPNQSYSLAQPVNFSLNRHENNHVGKDPSLSSRNSGHLSGESILFPGSSANPPIAPLPHNFSLHASETTLKTSANLLIPPAAQGPLNLAPENHKTTTTITTPSLEGGLAPQCTNASSLGTAGGSNNCGRPANGASSQELSHALDFTVTKTLEQSPSNGRGAPEAQDQQRFYQQVTRDTQGVAAPPVSQPQAQVALASQAATPPQPVLPSNPQPTPGTSSGPNPPQTPASYSQAMANNKPSNTTPPVSSAVDASQTTHPPSQQEPQQTPHNAFGVPPNPYYYYGHPYDAYPPSYHPPYPPMDPRMAHLYYQEDAYGRCDPSSYQYDSTAAYGDARGYRYTEPERPSSRASQTSDRPTSRQGYPDDYYNTKGRWSDYYADYYGYDYRDPSRTDRYPSSYDPRYRDPRTYDHRYWYDPEHSPYQKREPYPYGNSHERYEDHWRYDPRFAGSFDEDLEPRRDPYGDDFDRRSIHSEHSGHSLHSSHSIHSRHSSFSSRSQQSQLYRSNHDLTAGAYEADHRPASLHTEYSCGGYPPYMNPPSLADYNHSAQAAWPTVEQVPSRPLTPEKFSVPHVCARFGPGGYLIKALPNLPSEGQPALVEIHSMEMMMQHLPEQEEMRAFPGPLTKDDTHKVDVINFAQNKATRCSQDEVLLDKESACLLWDFIVLLCRQNGTVVGTDIAELLLRDHKTVWLPGKSPNEANLIDFTNEALDHAEEESGEAQLSFLTDSLIATIDSLEKETERFRELLLYGRKKDALESAMKHGLWGHALLLASKMDSRTHARVMTRFANSLPINDPLQTVYQLMSGRMPAASTCCGDEKWGDWRPHLAMVLSNLTNNMDVETRTIITMGDTLVSKGLLEAAHFCYLMAQVGFGVYTKKTTKLVLIGSNHSLPFRRFATNEAIQRTEAYEYAQSLGTQPCCLPNFQVFKFIYACRLAEVGLAAQAFHYCEVISKAILKSPSYYSPVLISQVIQMSSRLRLFDPQMKEKPEQELFIEPDWLGQLRGLDGQIKEGCLTYSAGRATPQQYACSTPSSEMDHVSQNEGIGAAQEMNPGPENPLLASLLPGSTQPTPGVQLMPSAPQTILESAAATTMGLSSQQEVPNAVPFYSVAPSNVGPGPGFVGSYAMDPSPVSSGMMGPPASLPPQPHELQPQEPLRQETALQAAPRESPSWKPPPEPREDDFYGKMASMGFGPRSRTTSESSVHSVGRERRSSAARQPSPPAPSAPEGKGPTKEAKKEPAPRKSGATWFGWLMGKGKNEAHLPDDKNKSIVWDEKKQRWVNLDEPEEESKPPPPPPTGFPQVTQAAPMGPVGPPNASVNMFSRRAAGSKARYVDVLNPSRTKSPGAAPAPSDLFAPLAPMPIPANLFVPNAVAEEPQPLEGQVAEEQGTPEPEPGPETTAELSAPSSGGPPAGAVQFYNPSQFAQPAAVSGGSRLGRIGQRKYPTLK